jgi:hypothetical protein
LERSVAAVFDMGIREAGVVNLPAAGRCHGIVSRIVNRQS